MEKEKQQETLAIIRYLLELAKGQWNASLTEVRAAVQSGHEVAISQQALLLAGLLGEELRSLILHKALVNPRKRYGLIQFGLLLLDGDFSIRAIGEGTAAYLGYSDVFLYRSPLDPLLSADSGKAFHKCFPFADGTTSQFIDLQFISATGGLLMTSCVLTSVVYAKSAYALSLYAIREQQLPTKNKLPKENQKVLDAVQGTYDYVLSHRDGPLPSSHALSRKFGTNEFELKRAFKKRFGMGIYQCYTVQRLMRAKELIDHTDLPLTQVAQKSGFEEYSGFARAFKKHFGLSPAKARELPAER